MNMMKRITVILTIMTFMTAMTGTAFAQNTSTPVGTKSSVSAQATSTGTQGTFADKNKDGACEHHQAKMQNGKCANFTDKNGDGVCDNCKSNCVNKGNPNCCGKGCQYHQGNGNGKCGKNSSGCPRSNNCPNKQQTGNTQLPDSKDKN